MGKRQSPIPVYADTYQNVKEKKGDRTFDELISMWAERYGEDS
ncbi:hypothetical protein [Halorussus limi]|nr:hypothetical protein [Halorussus limi]